ncbi:hypothetical protein [Croceicoccus bisphenolivorans]|uniref:hypothetical protein n=1 Tax=Croceicoccus bisphenolivorans TaxID=1783232 RepID=UPI000834B975|nr:hypothetical protein [Croceicoccus bisphenolivorans]
MSAAETALGAGSENPPVGGATEGQCNSVRAIARSLYVASYMDGKAEPVVRLPRRAIDGAVAVLIAALDWADGDDDREPNGDDEPDSDAEPEDGL